MDSLDEYNGILFLFKLIILTRHILNIKHYFSVLQFKIAVLNVYSYKRIRECIEKQDTIIDILNFNT